MSILSSSHPQQQSNEFWRRSFFNLLQRELNQWLPNHRKFWFSILIWTIVTYIVSGIWFQSNQDVAPPSYTSTISGWLFVSSMRGVFSLQGIISEEKLTGTLAWILSKPVPRSAFYLAKLISQMIVTFVISVLVQGIFFSLTSLQNANQPGFLLTSLFLALIIWFYQSLITMLDVIIGSKVAKMAIPVALILIGNFFTFIQPNQDIDVMAFLGHILPWGINARMLKNDLAMLAATGQHLTNIIPVVATVLWIPIFSIIGIWRLNSQEI